MEVKTEVLTSVEKVDLPIKTEEISRPDSLDITEAQGYDENATKKLLSKLDWHLIPFLSLIYL